jgi:hypothetical protein
MILEPVSVLYNPIEFATTASAGGSTVHWHCMGGLAFGITITSASRVWPLHPTPDEAEVRTRPLDDKES